MSGISNSIIVVSFNGQLPLLAFLKSLKINEAIATEVIVVDNGSFDESIAMVRKHYPHVRILAQAANRGFWAAANKGIDAAEGDVVVLCHNDVLADVHTLSDLADQARESAGRKVAAVAPIIRGVDGEEQPVVGSLPGLGAALSGTFFPGGVVRLATPTLDHLQSGQSARFVCIALNREAAAAVGTFDERFFLYHGDTDWCARLHERSSRLLFSRTTMVTHAGAGSLQSLPPHLLRLLRRDQQTYSVKHQAGWQKPILQLANRLRTKLGRP